MPFSWPLVELVFDRLNLSFGELGEVAALGEVLAQEAVEIFIAAALPSGVWLSEVARGIERDVDQCVFGELAAVVPGERVHTGADRIQGRQDRSHRGVGFTVGDTPHAQQARLALDQRDDASEALADDRVTLPVATMKVAMPFARPLVELVFDLLNLGIGEGAQIAALGKSTGAAGRSYFRYCRVAKLNTARRSSSSH